MTEQRYQLVIHHTELCVGLVEIDQQGRFLQWEEDPVQFYPRRFDTLVDAQERLGQMFVDSIAWHPEHYDDIVQGFQFRRRIPAIKRICMKGEIAEHITAADDIDKQKRADL